MNQPRLARLAFWLCAPILLAFSMAATAQTTYTVTDLGTVGGYSSGARSINATGQITGYSIVSGSNNASDAFLYSSGRMRSLGTLGGNSAIGLAINSTGEVAGYSTLASGDYNGFLYNGSRMISVGSLVCCYSDAEGINDSGQVTGASTAANGEVHPHLYSNGTLTDLGTLGAHNSQYWNTGQAVNNAGEVVGWSCNAQGNFLAFLWSNGHIRSLGTLGGAWSEADGINDLGQITGLAYIKNDIGTDAFLYDGAVMQDLGTITSPRGGKGRYAQGFGINSFGVVVGQSTYQQNPRWIVYHAFVAPRLLVMESITM